MSIKELSQSILDASKSVIELSELKVAMQIVPGSEKKLMPLAKKAGVRFQKPKPGDDEAHVVGDKKSLRKFMMARGMNSDDIEDSHPELKEETIEEKKLDPVGKADADIDNDGDTDSSDEYLHKRRSAIKQAMKKEGNKFTLALAQAKEKGEKSFVCAGRKYNVQEVEELEKDPKKKEIKEKDVKETTMMSGKPEKKNIYQVRKDMQKSVKDANQKLKDAEQRKKDRLRKMQDDESGMKKEELMNDLLPILEKYDIELISEIIDSVGVKEEVDKLAVKKYANMKAKIGTLQNNIAKTKDNKFRMKSGGQQKIDGWNRDIENLRDNMKKMVDKYGSGVTKSDTLGFTGGN